MKIGITEAGDAGIDLSWVQAVENKTVDGAILITKNLTPLFIDEVLRLHTLQNKLIVHCTCTGWGQSVLEPNVPDFTTQLNNLIRLISSGFPVERCVLRIDPIIPTKSGLMAVKNVLNYVNTQPILSNIRIRISVMDEYMHVKERLKSAGFEPFYGDNMQASYEQMKEMVDILSDYNHTYETCAEMRLNNSIFEQTGCVSEKDLTILGIALSENLYQNPQNRKGCRCLSCKQELLHTKHRCPHGCLYCYWRD